MRSRVITSVLIIWTILTFNFGCVSSDKSSKSVDSPVETSKGSDDSEMGNCFYNSTPEGILAISVILTGSNPLLTLGSLLFYGGDFYVCMTADSADNDYSQEKTKAMEKIRKEISEELRADFQKIVTKLNEQSDDNIYKLEDIRNKIRAMGESERQIIEKMTSKILREIYEQMERIQNSEIEFKRYQNRR
tara:strand:+ start:136 stop:705 length:570 start_codon:yes stop_codon:yes gene_type:complete